MSAEIQNYMTHLELGLSGNKARNKLQLQYTYIFISERVRHGPVKSAVFPVVKREIVLDNVQYCSHC